MTTFHRLFVAYAWADRSPFSGRPLERGHGNIVLAGYPAPLGADDVADLERFIAAQRRNAGIPAEYIVLTGWQVMT